MLSLHHMRARLHRWTFGFAIFWISAWALAALEPCCGDGMELSGHRHAGGVVHSAVHTHADADHGKAHHRTDSPLSSGGHAHCPQLDDPGADDTLRPAEKGPGEAPAALPSRPPVAVGGVSRPACTLAESPGWGPGRSSETYLHTLRLRI